MPSSNPRYGFGLASIVILAAAVIGGVWVLSAPRKHSPIPTRLAMASGAPADAAASAKDSADAGVSVIELPPAVPSDQQQSQSDDEAPPERPAAAEAAVPGVVGQPITPPAASSWTEYGVAAPFARGSGAQGSAGAVASTGGGLTVGLTSGRGDDAGEPSAQTGGSLRHAGWVMMAGGQVGQKAASRKAQLFDPARMRWVATGSMHDARENHTATLLPDGNTLVAGGEGPKGAALAAAELYELGAGTFQTTGAMNAARGGHSATLISGCSCPADGKVLIAGGSTAVPHGDTLASAELYDPAAGTFTATGSMKTARSGATATLIASGPLSGDILIAGGLGNGGTRLASAELYDPRAGTFSETGAMTTARAYHTATWLGYRSFSGTLAGDILIAGGETTSGVTKSTELYNPATGKFSAATVMTAPRAAQAAVTMGDGRVLIAGGYGISANLLNSAEIFNPIDGTFQATVSMSSVHAGGVGVMLDDGRVLIAGGRSSNADVYSPTLGTFAMTTPMRVALLNAPAVTLP